MSFLAAFVVIPRIFWIFFLFALANYDVYQYIRYILIIPKGRNLEWLNQENEMVKKSHQIVKSIDLNGNCHCLSAQYCTVLHSTAQYCTVLRSAVQYSLAMCAAGSPIFVFVFVYLIYKCSK